MTEKNDKLDVDLDFLGPEPQSHALKNPAYKYNWRNIVLIVGGGIALVAFILLGQGPKRSTYAEPATDPSATFADVPAEDAPTYTEVPTVEESAPVAEEAQVRHGQYMCSADESRAADRLKPPDSASALDVQTSALQFTANELETLKDEIESMQPDETSQDEVDAYNASVDEFNTGLSSYRLDREAHQMRLDHFNAQVDEYNAYLASHCRPN